MTCSIRTSRYADPFEAVRREFQRQTGVRSEPTFAHASVTETENGVVLSFDLPGIPENQITLIVENGELRISGERMCSVPDGATQLFSNRPSGKFQRVLKLDDSIDPDSIDAVLSDGVLTIQMSRRAELQPRTITVRSAKPDSST